MNGISHDKVRNLLVQSVKDETGQTHDNVKALCNELLGENDIDIDDRLAELMSEALRTSFIAQTYALALLIEEG